MQEPPSIHPTPQNVLTLQEDEPIQIEDQPAVMQVQMDLNQNAISQDDNDDDPDDQPQQPINPVDQKDSQHLPPNQQPPVNPVSAYMVFTRSWKLNNPNQKLSFTNLSAIWREMTTVDKAQFVQQYYKQRAAYQKWDLARAVDGHPTTGEGGRISNTSSLFPLNKVKGIIKQGTTRTMKPEGILAASRAMEYFGVALLEEVKRANQTRGRLEPQHLFEAIRSNDKMFGFLEGLVEQYEPNQKEKTNTQPTQNEPIRTVQPNDDAIAMETNHQLTNLAIHWGDKQPNHNQQPTQKHKSVHNKPAKAIPINQTQLNGFLASTTSSTMSSAKQ